MARRVQISGQIYGRYHTLAPRPGGMLGKGEDIVCARSNAGVRAMSARRILGLEQIYLLSLRETAG